MAGLLEEAFYRTPFVNRHIGPTEAEQKKMLETLGRPSIENLVDTAVPASIRDDTPPDLPEPVTEEAALKELAAMMAQNRTDYRSWIGMGYHGTLVPPVIQINILENPGWYTQYTPYQSEIAQGRLEALLNFQTMVADLTGLDIANASLLDEGTAAAEAMNMCLNLKKRNQSEIFFIATDCHPQTIELVRTRAEALDVEVRVGDPDQFDSGDDLPFAVLVQNPATDGRIRDYSALADRLHQNGGFLVMACDLLSLCLMKSPGEMGADIAVGTSQRFGVPMAFGGPHAGFLACRDSYKRKLPGRLVGVSRDSQGKQGLRLALATREQHIRRDKATSNICTAQVLLAIMSGMYAVYHGPQGLKNIATAVHARARLLAAGLSKAGLGVVHEQYFDTLLIRSAGAAAQWMQKALDQKINLRLVDADHVSIALDETTTAEDLQDLLRVFDASTDLEDLAREAKPELPAGLQRTSAYLSHPIFNSWHSETEMQRYIRKLESRDLSLTRSMIPLGSCTMKLNAAAEMLPVTWPEVNSLHPFVPREQAQGFYQLFENLESWLAATTGFAGVSLQPNSGAQGEYAGLLVIARYHESRGEGHRRICLIPSSAHGTNPASAALAGMKIVVVRCDGDGNIDLADLKEKAATHKDNLAALMVTYPSTHGVFEEGIVEICDTIHEHGGQVYMDGANLQAQISLCYAGKFGPDVCHLNLHKTFCIPHGGGGPGVGPIAVRKHLCPYLPGHPVVKTGGDHATGPVSSAPFGSPGVLPISWMYIRMMGADGLRDATRVSILSANYIAKRLQDHYPVVYTGREGLVAHECIIDLKQAKKTAGIDENDIAKRLMDYGFHAPTVSWPVPHSMMIEPTESESLREIDRFCEAMISISKEIDAIARGEFPADDNPLKNAPHSADMVLSDGWDHPYSRETAAFPAMVVRDNKFWPFVSRIDNAWGDRHPVCSCPLPGAFEE